MKHIKNHLPALILLLVYHLLRLCSFSKSRRCTIAFHWNIKGEVDAYASAGELACACSSPLRYFSCFAHAILFF